MGQRIFITAAEVSGDLHASHLIRKLRELDPALVIEGHGGPRMRAAGAVIHHETTANAAMGFSALGRVREMFSLLKWTRAYFKTNPPDLQICVDSPALNFHFAKIAHQAGRPVLYYVAPQLWAWREGRMKKLRKWVDRVACILPFEEAYFRGHGVDATFVGHPLLDEMEVRTGGHEGGRETTDMPTPAGTHLREVAPTGAGVGMAPDTRVVTAGEADFGDSPTIGLLAGSRRSEAERNFPRMLEVAAQIKQRFGRARFLLPTTVATMPIVSRLFLSLPRSSLLSSSPSHFEVRQDAFDDLVPRCDLVITVSGTATLHAALHGTPMIVVYHGSPLLWNAVGRWLIKTRTYTLVNLLAADPALASSGRVTHDMHIVPEFIPWYGSTQPVAARALEMLANPEQLSAQRSNLAMLAEKLNGPGSARLNTARMAMEMLARVAVTQ